MQAEKDSFRILKGQPKIYVKTADSGNKRQQAFCGNCGTPIYATSAGDGPKSYGIRVGSIRQRDRLVPDLAILDPLGATLGREHRHAAEGGERIRSAQTRGAFVANTHSNAGANAKRCRVAILGGSGLNVNFTHARKERRMPSGSANSARMFRQKLIAKPIASSHNSPDSLPPVKKLSRDPTGREQRTPKCPECFFHSSDCCLPLWRPASIYL